MRRALASLRWILVAAIAIVAVAVAGILVLTRTPWGVQRVGGYVVRSIGSGIHGKLTVGRIRSGGLLGGVLLDRVSIVDSAGRPFVAVDSARTTYGWRSLLSGQIVLGSLDLYHPVVVIEELPGDTLWNYEKIFMDTSTTPGAPRLVRFSDVRVFDGDATIAFPLDVKGRIQPDDTARLVVRPAGRGLQRLMHFQQIEATLPDVLWESPTEPGRLFKFSSLSGRGYVWSTPFTIRQAAGTLATHDSIVSFDMPQVRLAQSDGAVLGRVVVRHDQNDYDIRITGRRLAFGDLGWLYPRLPQQGGGSGDIRILSVPRGTLWSIRNARLETRGTRVAGSFGIVTGDTLYFTQVNLRAAPFDLKLVQSMLPGKLPIQGLLVGTVVVQGPLSALQTHGDLRLDPGAGADASAFRWAGTVDFRRPFGAREFRADIERLDLALLSSLNPDLKLQGAVSGRIDATGRFDRSVRLVADLEHTLPGYSASHVTGSGDVTWTRRNSNFDLHFEAVPVALDALAHAFPALLRLEGTARGPVTVRGSLADLAVNADLETSAGRLAVDGRFDLASKRPAFHAAGELTGFHLDQVLDGIPPTTISGKYGLDGSGKSLADADAAVTLDVRGGRLGALALRGGALRLQLRDGLAHVDSLQLATAAGSVAGKGELGLRADRRGTLEVSVDADSLGALQPFFFADTATDELQAPVRMGGTLRVRGTLSGSVSAFDVSATGTLARARFGTGSATRALLTLTGSALASAHPSWKLQGSADTLRLGGVLFPATTLTTDYASPAGSFSFAATGSDGGAYALGGDYHYHGDSADVALRDARFGAGASAWHLTAPASLRVFGGSILADSLVLQRAGGGRVHADGRLAWAAQPARGSAPESFKLQLEQVPAEDFLRLLKAEPAAGGRITGQLSVAGTAASPRIDGDLAVDSARFQELRLDRLDARLAYADRHLDSWFQGAAGGAAVFTAEGRLPMDLAFSPSRKRLPDEPIDYSFRADSLPASLATTLLDGFSGVRGRLDGQIRIGGTARSPKLDGELILKDGAAAWVASGVTYTDAQARFGMKGDGAVQLDASARAGGGRATGTGRLIFGSDWANPRFELAAKLQSFWAAHRQEADVTATGDLRLGGRYRAPVVSGWMRVDRGVLFVDEIWRQYNIVALDDSLLFNVVDTSVSSVRKVITQEAESDFIRNLTVDSFTVDVGREGWLRGKDMNVEVSGALNVFYRRAADDLRLTGQLNAIRGTYLLYSGHRFDVKGGTVEFIGTAGLNPLLDISAVYKARTCETSQPVNIQAAVTATLENPRVALSSDAQPAISQSDLVSCLLFGVPTYRLTPGQSKAMQAAGLDFGRSALFGSFSSGLESVGRNVGLDYVSLTSGESVPRNAGATPVSSNAIMSFLAGSRIDVGRYVGDQFFLAASAGLTSNGTAQPFRGARLEWRFRPTWTGEFFIDDRAARIPSAGYSLDPTAEQKKVLGFFLYREWGY